MLSENLQINRNSNECKIIETFDSKKLRNEKQFNINFDKYCIE